MARRASKKSVKRFVRAMAVLGALGALGAAGAYKTRKFVRSTGGKRYLARELMGLS